MSLEPEQSMHAAFLTIHAGDQGSIEWRHQDERCNHSLHGSLGRGNTRPGTRLQRFSPCQESVHRQPLTMRVNQHRTQVDGQGLAPEHMLWGGSLPNGQEAWEKTTTRQRARGIGITAIASRGGQNQRWRARHSPQIALPQKIPH